MQMKFNPRRADFVKLVSPHLPTVEQLATVAEDKSTLQLCKTGRHCLLTIVIKLFQQGEEWLACYQCRLSLPPLLGSIIFTVTSFIQLLPLY